MLRLHLTVSLGLPRAKLCAAGLLAAVSIAAHLSCGDSRGDLVFEDPSLISVATSLDRDSLHPGDTLRITVTATNPTDQRVRVRLSDCGCGCEGGPAFEVRTPDGAVVDGPTGGGCFLLQPEPGELELGPGQAESA